MSIKYEAYTKLGQKLKSVLETDSEEDAYDLLESEDLIPYRLRPVRPRRTLASIAPGLFRPRLQEVIDFTRQVTALLNSGIPLRRALIAERDHVRSPTLKPKSTEGMTMQQRNGR